MAIGETYIGSFGQKIEPIPVTVSAAREFMGRIASEDMWPSLNEKPQWGSHMHRVLLHIALSEDPEEQFDLGRLFIEERIRDNPRLDSIGPESSVEVYLRGLSCASAEDLNVVIGKLFPFGYAEIE